MRFWVLPLLAAVFAPAGTSAAPGKAARAPVKKEVVRIWGYAANEYDRREIADRDAARQPEVIGRTGAARGDPAGWLPLNDPALALMQRNPKLQAEASLFLSFDATGKSDLCVVKSQTGSAALINGICDRLRPHARLDSPMSRDGQRFVENLNLFVNFTGARAVTPPRPIPSVPPMPPAWYSGSAPSYVQHILKVTGMPMAPDPAAIRPEAVITGITVRVEAGRPTRCIVGYAFRSSANADRACELALKASYVGENTGKSPIFLPMVFIGTGDKMAGLAPRYFSEKSAEIKHESPARLAELVATTDAKATLKPVEARLLVDVDRGAIDCWLTTGSGSDQADLKICGFLMTGGHFNPGQDIFGRIANSSVYGLELGKNGP